MSASLDVNLLPVGRAAGQDYPELLSLYACEAPRRAARGRDGDRLMLYMAMQGNAPLPPAKQDQALADLAAVYFRTPGSATAALRAVAETLNAWLLERNAQLGVTRQGIATLAQVVLRGEQLLLAHSGPVHTFLISASQTLHFYNPDMEDRGLGQGKAPPISYYQAALQASDTLLLSSQPDPAWSEETLVGLHGQGPESLRRRLFHTGLLNLNAVLAQARPGKGLFYMPRPGEKRPGTEDRRQRTEDREPQALPVKPVTTAPAAVETPPAPPAPAVPLPPPPAPALESEPASAADAALPWEDAAAGDDAPPWEDAPAVEDAQLFVDESAAEDASATAMDEAVVGPLPATQDGDAVALAAPAAPLPAAPVPASAIPEQTLDTLEAAQVAQADEPSAPARLPRRTGPAAEQAKQMAGKVGAGLLSGLGAAGGGLKTLLARMLPGDIFSSLPSSMMAFIALVTPLVIVIVATMVYLRLGRDVQYDTLLAQAQAMAVRGLEQKDTQLRRADLETAMGLIVKAEAMRAPSADLTAMHDRVQAAVDEMDMVQRIDYQPAIINGLPPEVNVTRIVLIEDGLYLLDGNTGSVLRAADTGQGFAVDTAFQCGPSAASVTPIGPLVEIAAWPAGFKPAASLIAMDAAGQVLYCSPDDAPKSEPLTQPGATDAWGGITSFVIDDGDTYVLDKPSKGVWIYWRSNYPPDPTLFFNEEIPVLEDVTDMAGNLGDLYLLHRDGSLTLCSYSGVPGSPTRCSQPRYTDARPGRERLPFVPVTPFAQLQNTPPPDPSLFFLEADGQVIDHFSLRNLVFQGQVVPKTALASSRPATAFLVDNIGHTLYLAVGNQVFYGVLP